MILGANVRERLIVFAALFMAATSLLYRAENPRRCIVFLDAGHSAAQPGAISSRGVPEHIFNLRLAGRLEQIFLHKGPLRPELFPTNDKISPSPADRARKANADGACILLSIHHDSVQPRYLSKWRYKGTTRFYCDIFHGYSIFFSGANPRARESRELAMDIGQALRTAGFIPTLHHAEHIPGEGRDLVDAWRGVYRFDGLSVLKNASMPAVLLEAGVIVNRSEELLLSDPAYQEQMAAAVYQGICAYCLCHGLIHPATLVERPIDSKGMRSARSISSR